MEGGDKLMEEKSTMPAGKQVGKVTHYYDKIGVAIVNLSSLLSIGDLIKVVGKGGDFTQKVSSMQIEHENVEKARKGDVVGIKVEQKVKENDLVYAV